LLCMIFTYSCGCLTTVENSITTPSNQTIVDNRSQENQVMSYHTLNRIIPSNSDAAELLITLGAGDRIVGIPDTIMARPEILAKISSGTPSIGSSSTPDVERMLTLKPDAFITYPSYKPKNFDKIAATNITVVMLNCYKINELPNDAYTLGEMTGMQQNASRYMAFMKKYQNLIQSRLENISSRDCPSVYGEESSDFTVMTQNGHGGQILSLLHAKNIYGNSTEPEWPIVTSEWIIIQDPDIIIKSKGYNDANLKESYNRLINRTGYQELNAVKTGKVYVYNQDLTSSPRAVIGMVYFAKLIYPDRFADIDPDSVRKEYGQAFGFGNEDQDWIYPPLNSSVPNNSEQKISGYNLGG
jgi:iron complex transport system substrate-binding protein